MSRQKIQRLGIIALFICFIVGFSLGFFNGHKYASANKVSVISTDITTGEDYTEVKRLKVAKIATEEEATSDIITKDEVTTKELAAAADLGQIVRTKVETLTKAEETETSAKSSETTTATEEVFEDSEVETVSVDETPAEVVEEVATPIENTSYQSGIFSEDDVIMLAKLLYGEANGVESVAERAMVIWTVLNRYDSAYYPDTIYDIVTEPLQFTGYDYYHPVTDRNLNLVYDVIERYAREKRGEENVGRVLPSDILFFNADEWYEHNEFYKYSDGLSGYKIYFDYDCPPENPYPY